MRLRSPVFAPGLERREEWQFALLVLSLFVVERMKTPAVPPPPTVVSPPSDHRRPLPVRPPRSC